LIADPDSDIGLDPSWVQIYPYQAIAAPGQPAELEIRVRNHRSVPITVEIALSLPAGWRSNPSSVKMQVPPRQSSRAPIKVTVPSDWREARGRRAIAADVVADGRYLGQIAEAVVEIRQKQGHS
jgi:uncharacterized membrane protein